MISEYTYNYSNIHIHAHIHKYFSVQSSFLPGESSIIVLGSEVCSSIMQAWKFSQVSAFTRLLRKLNECLTVSCLWMDRALIHSPQLFMLRRQKCPCPNPVSSCCEDRNVHVPIQSLYAAKREMFTSQSSNASQALTVET